MVTRRAISSLFRSSRRYLHYPAPHTPSAPPAPKAPTVGPTSKITDEFTGTGAIGEVCQVIGVVVDVRFSDGLPPILTTLDVLDNSISLILEVAQHLSQNMVRTIAMDGNEGLIHGQCVLNTSSPLTVPSGRVTLERIINVIGEENDHMGDIMISHYLPIHREAPTFVEQATEQQILVTGGFRIHCRVARNLASSNMDFFCPKSPKVWDGNGFLACFADMIFGFGANMLTITAVLVLARAGRSLDIGISL